jgi:integrase
MASLRRKPRSPFWFACFSLPDGERTQRSTKLPDRKAAMKLALKWEEAARNRITEAQARRVLSDIHEQIHGAPLATPSVSDYAAQWMGRKAGEVTEVTRLAYKYATDAFTAFLGDKAAQPIHYVTPAQVAAWRDATAARATARTANNKLKIVRTLFQSAWQEGLLAENPAAKVKTLKAADGQRRPFTLDELGSILRVASAEWRGIIAVGFFTGQRLKDVAMLTWANVDLERKEIRLATSKTGRRQVVPIAKPLLEFLERLPAGDNPRAPLFPTAAPLALRAGGTSMLSQQFHGLMVAAGLVPARPAKHRSSGRGRRAARELNDVSFHSMRHTATSLFKALGVSESVTRDIIGHESAAVSRHYTHTDESAKRAAVDRLPNIFQL